MIYIGIDPGLTGAIAVISNDGVTLHDMPAISVKNGKTEIDGAAVRSLLADYRGRCFCALERAQVMPSKRGPKGASNEQGDDGDSKGRGPGTVSMFNYGKGFGIIQGILYGLEIPFELVAPQSWKASLMKGAPKEKGASRVVAGRLFPHAAKHLTLVKHHGRADALLLAEFGRRQHSNSAFSLS